MKKLLLLTSLLGLFAFGVVAPTKFDNGVITDTLNATKVVKIGTTKFTTLGDGYSLFNADVTINGRLTVSTINGVIGSINFTINTLNANSAIIGGVQIGLNTVTSNYFIGNGAFLTSINSGGGISTANGDLRYAPITINFLTTNNAFGFFVTLSNNSYVTNNYYPDVYLNGNLNTGRIYSSGNIVNVGGVEKTVSGNFHSFPAQTGVPNWSSSAGTTYGIANVSGYQALFIDGDDPSHYIYQSVSVSVGFSYVYTVTTYLDRSHYALGYSIGDESICSSENYSNSGPQINSFTFVPTQSPVFIKLKSQGFFFEAYYGGVSIKEQSYISTHVLSADVLVGNGSSITGLPVYLNTSNADVRYLGISNTANYALSTNYSSLTNTANTVAFTSNTINLGIINCNLITGNFTGVVMSKLITSTKNANGYPDNITIKPMSAFNGGNVDISDSDSNTASGVYIHSDSTGGLVAINSNTGTGTISLTSYKTLFEGIVGIGTAGYDPKAKLEVVGKISCDSLIVNNGVSVNNSISANYFIGNGSLLSGLSTGGGGITTASADLRYSSISTVYLTTQNAYAVFVTLTNNAYITTNFNGSISANGTISANFFSGNGSRLTSVATVNNSITANYAVTAGYAASIPVQPIYLTTVNADARYISANQNTLISFNASLRVQGLSINVLSTNNSTVLDIKGTQNTFMQINIVNQSNGLNAEAGYCISDVDGTATKNFAWFGRNGVSFNAVTSYNVGISRDMEILNLGGDIAIASDKGIKFYAGDTSETKRIMTISANGIAIGTINASAQLDIHGTGNYLTNSLAFQVSDVSGNPAMTVFNNGLTSINSLKVENTVTASYFVGNGSLLTGVVGGSGISTTNAYTLFVSRNDTTYVTNNYSGTVTATAFVGGGAGITGLAVYLTTVNADLRYLPIATPIGILTANADTRYDLKGVINGLTTANAYGIFVTATNNLYVTTNYNGSISANGTVSANKFAGRMLGNWIVDSTRAYYSVDTVYRAVTSDIFVTVQCGTAGGGYATAFTDGSNPPTTKIIQTATDITSGTYFMFPVRKGDYWKLVQNAQTWSAGYIIATIPIGSF